MKPTLLVAAAALAILSQPAFAGEKPGRQQVRGDDKGCGESRR